MDKNTPIIPISHASLILNMGDIVIYNDPTGDASLYEKYNKPNIILVSDIHSDHASPDTLKAISTDDTIIVVPQAVADELPSGIPGVLNIIQNGQSINLKGMAITAVPMYNVPETDNAYHTKGRGNGYVLEDSNQRIYIAGDTSFTDEMRALKNIDIAFIPMNLPYTMSEDEAAEAVLAFKPKVVIPYHYRGKDGYSDTQKFKELVHAGDPNIKVELMDFYKE